MSEDAWKLLSSSEGQYLCKPFNQFFVLVNWGQASAEEATAPGIIWRSCGKFQGCNCSKNLSQERWHINSSEQIPAYRFELSGPRPIIVVVIVSTALTSVGGHYPPFRPFLDLHNYIKLYILLDISSSQDCVSIFFTHACGFSQTDDKNKMATAFIWTQDCWTRSKCFTSMMDGLGKETGSNYQRRKQAYVSIPSRAYLQRLVCS